jgi:hypothetical protein
MSTFFADYPVRSGGSSGVSSLNSLTGALTLVAGTGISITPSGSSITISSTGGLPPPLEALGTYTPNALGSPGTFLGNDSDTDTNSQVVFGSTDTAIAANPTSNVYLLAGDNTATSATGHAGSIYLQGGDIASGNARGGNVTITSGSTDSRPAGYISLSSGNSNSGGGGAITLQTGTGSSRGIIGFLNGTEGTAGWVWTSVDTSGTGAWVAPAGGIPAPLEAVNNYTPNATGGVGTFVGNVSANDQTNQQVVFGSTDVSTNEYNSMVYVLSGDLTASGSTRYANGVTIQAGSVVNGSGGAGNVQVNGGTAAAGSAVGGAVMINGGGSSTNQAGGVNITGGTGSSAGSSGGNVTIQAGIGVHVNGAIRLDVNNGSSIIEYDGLGVAFAPTTTVTLGSTTSPWGPVYSTSLNDSSGAQQLAWTTTGVTIGPSGITTEQHTLNTLLATNGSGVGTLTNLPSGASGNPTGYVQITINGGTHYLPYW